MVGDGNVRESAWLESEGRIASEQARQGPSTAHLDSIEARRPRQTGARLEKNHGQERDVGAVEQPTEQQSARINSQL